MIRSSAKILFASIISLVVFQPLPINVQQPHFYTQKETDTYNIHSISNEIKNNTENIREKERKALSIFKNLIKRVKKSDRKKLDAKKSNFETQTFLDTSVQKVQFDVICNCPKRQKKDTTQ